MCLLYVPLITNQPGRSISRQCIYSGLFGCWCTALQLEIRVDQYQGNVYTVVSLAVGAPHFSWKLGFKIMHEFRSS
jgi:hypothetical protein